MKTILYQTTLLAMLCIGTAQAQQIDLPDGRDFSIADVFYPGLHLDMAAGGSSTGPDELEIGGHDPSRDGFTLQSLELDLSVRLNDYVEGFAAWNLFWGGAEEEWGDEWEEVFGKLTNLPGGLEVRGGRMLSRFGTRNAQHQHSWSTVDQNLMIVRFLGEDGLAQDGADVTWYMPTPITTALTVSYGEVKAHSHGHEEVPHHEDEHSSHNDEAAGQEIQFADEFFSGNIVAQVNYDDFNQFAFGGSLATGDNGLGGDTQIYALNASYTWRENGLEAGGRYLIWNNEAMLRDYDVGDGGHDDEHLDEDHDDESDMRGDHEVGFSSELIYGMNDILDVGARLGYVAGIDEIGLRKRYRLSPLTTIYLSQKRNLFLRLQYSYDDWEGGLDAHSAWAQLHYSFGGVEVR